MFEEEEEKENNIFCPYNPLNQEITKRTVEAILKKYGVPSKIYNFNLYKRAFVHKSYVKKPDKENELNKLVLDENLSI